MRIDQFFGFIPQQFERELAVPCWGTVKFIVCGLVRFSELFLRGISIAEMMSGHRQEIVDVAGGRVVVFTGCQSFLQLLFRFVILASPHQNGAEAIEVLLIVRLLLYGLPSQFDGWFVVIQSIRSQSTRPRGEVSFKWIFRFEELLNRLLAIALVLRLFIK